MDEALAGQPPGLYVLSAAIPDADPYDTPPATQWFILSDLGISTWDGTDGMVVGVRSLATAAPVEGVALALVSAGNAVLGTATTDADGLARFPAGLTRGTGAAQPALVTATLRRRSGVPAADRSGVRPVRPGRRGARAGRARSTCSSPPTAAPTAPARRCI